jgi:hypothetical protein
MGKPFIQKKGLVDVPRSALTLDLYSLGMLRNVYCHSTNRQSPAVQLAVKIM